MNPGSLAKSPKPKGCVGLVDNVMLGPAPGKHGHIFGIESPKQLQTKHLGVHFFFPQPQSFIGCMSF